jgi:hypothetical protein
MAYRVGSNVEGSGTHHQAGYYHIFVRAKVDNADTQAGVRMNTSWRTWTTATPRSTYATQYIDGDTNYRMIPLATAMIPPSGLRNVMQNIGASANSLWQIILVNLEAEKIAGTGNLWLDCLVFLPAEHSVFVDDMDLDTATVLNILTNEDGTIEAYTLNAAENAYHHFPTISDTGMKPWGYPIDGGIFVILGERETVHNLVDDADVVDVDAIYKRWSIYNG